MRSFLSEIATSLYDRYGDEVSSLTLVFPSRRARLFFSDALSRIARRPLWQPRFASVDELMERIAGVRRSEPVKLLTELYKIYSRHHSETFDAFYFWGEMLLSDFDQIDKYEIQADMLFANIGDLHRLEDHFGYLTPEQVELIRRFWSHFRQQANYSPEQQQFIRIWESLGSIYHAFRESLSAQGLAYEGMVHRLSAERLRSGKAVDIDPGERFVVVGFNALSTCEKQLLRWLQKRGTTEFYWDYDHYYVEKNPDYEAGLFLRSNLRDFPAPEGVVGSNHFDAPKEMVSVAAPSDSLQCKYVHTFLQELLDRDLSPGQETAIVLTDETLLPQVLYSIPSGIEAVNITMGYPLRQTTAYSFVERLIELQRRKRRRSGGVQFYHSDVTGLLGHPYILEQNAAAASEVLSGLRKAQSVYIRADRFHIPGVIEAIFRPVEGWRNLGVYLRTILSEIGAREAPEEDRARRREFFSTIIDRLVQLETALSDSGLELSESVFCSLLRKILQQIRIPYQGEPLAGIQIMGILETRNIDFENVLVLSLNDDTFPGNRAISSSFVPHNLRLAYGLPTPLHHEGVYAYYFYRLLQRAQRVHLAYCSRSDERRSGEPSRYLYQLQYESPHVPAVRNIPLSVNLPGNPPLSVPKTGAVAEALRTYLGDNGPKLSPTGFYAYIECPLKFYFRRIAGLRPTEEISEEIDLPLFGTILHKAMEILYAPLCGEASPGERIAALTASEAVPQAVAVALDSEYFKENPLAAGEEVPGSVLLVRDTVCRYIRGSILPYDAAQSGFSIQALEQEVEAPFSFSLGEGTARVRFGGMADRIDSLDNGLLRVVDYKTGKGTLPFGDIPALFSVRSAERRPAAFQTLLYSLALSRQTGRDIQPALYYVREMNRADYSPLLREKNTPLLRYSDYAEGFEEELSAALSGLFDTTIPFSPCEDTSTCRYCDYKEICRR